MKLLILVLLAPLLWPVYLLVWCAKHPEQTIRAIDTSVAFVRRHPKGTAWSGLAFGVLLFAGGIGELISPTRPGNPILGLAFSAGIVLLCGGLLVRWWWQEIQARNAEIARRADEQHQAYLRGDDLGLYGTRDMPKL